MLKQQLKNTTGDAVIVLQIFLHIHRMIYSGKHLCWAVTNSFAKDVRDCFQKIITT